MLVAYLQLLILILLWQNNLGQFILFMPLHNIAIGNSSAQSNSTMYIRPDVLVMFSHLLTFLVFLFFSVKELATKNHNSYIWVIPPKWSPSLLFLAMLWNLSFVKTIYFMKQYFHYCSRCRNAAGKMAVFQSSPLSHTVLIYAHEGIFIEY